MNSCNYQWDKKQKTNKPAYQRPTPVLFLLQLLLLVEFSLFFFQSKKQEKRLIAGWISVRSGHFRPQSGQESQRTKYFFESKPSNWRSHRCHFAFPQGNRPLNVDKSCQNKPCITFTRIWYTGRIQKELLLKKCHYRSSYGSHSAPLPLIVFPVHFFFRMLFARSTLDKRQGSGRIFYLCNPCKFSYRLGYCLQLKNFTVPRVTCKEKADSCKFLAVQKIL